MFKIDRLRLEIKTREATASSPLYGFDIPFKKGLNIIAGENSSGKSTICSCIFYALGMEELLGGQNDKALDKALKSTFTSIEDNNEVEHNIALSTIFIQLSNCKDEIVTIKRTINSIDSEDISNKKIIVYYSELSSIYEETTKQVPLFLRASRNNESANAFYSWLADFIGFNIPTITNNSRTDGESPLYLQTIFSALFIEQTKGWSDFFATLPHFGIPNNKDKIIEFILNLAELRISTEKDRIEKDSKVCKNNWKDTCSKIDILSKEFDVQTNVPNEITIDTQSLKTINATINTDDGCNKNIAELLKEYSAKIESIRKQPIKKNAENKAELRQKFAESSDNHRNFLSEFENFEELRLTQIDQYTSLKKQQLNIADELNALKGISQIFDETLIKKELYNTCPTCSQHVSIDLLESEGVQIEKLSLQQNIGYIDGQRKIVESTINSLSKVIEEKKIIKKYYLRKKYELEEVIKFILNDLISDDRDFSESDTLYRVQLETKIKELNYINERLSEYISDLEHISTSYRQLCADELDLESDSKEDSNKLDTLEDLFKVLLYKFGYSSNNRDRISLRRERPFNYLPVVNSYDSSFQQIRIGSSASDFIRSLWAYYLSLLNFGSNHPGILLFDEPGQHSMSSVSIKSLFNITAREKEKQIIIFTSIEKTLLGKDVLNLDVILNNLTVDSDYSIYKIRKGFKSIEILQQVE